MISISPLARFDESPALLESGDGPRGQNFRGAAPLMLHRDKAQPPNVWLGVNPSSFPFLPAPLEK
jgi:hypothetical protein